MRFFVSKTSQAKYFRCNSMSGYPPHPFLGYPQGSTGVPAPGYAQAPTSGYHQVASGGPVGPPGNAQYYSQVLSLNMYHEGLKAAFRPVA